MKAREFFEKMKQLWGANHVAERLLECCRRRTAGCHESHWLELKATLSPPESLFERYPLKDKERGGLPKEGSGDHVLHVLKDICSMLNNATGGIVLIGIDDDGKPAKQEFICDDPKYRPVPTPDGEWNSDRWKLWAKTKLKSPWEDKYGASWSCSMDLSSTSHLGEHSLEYLGFPALAFVAEPEEKPVSLLQTCCPGCYQKKDRTLDWCGWPQERPIKDRWPRVSHICRRVHGDTAAKEEWSVDDLLDDWKTRQTDSGDFKTSLKEERREKALLSTRKGKRTIDLFNPAEDFCRRTIRLCMRCSGTSAGPTDNPASDDKNAVINMIGEEDGHRLKTAAELCEKIEKDRKTGVTKMPGEEDGHRLKTAAAVCKQIAAYRKVSDPIPFLVDLEDLLPGDWRRLRESTETFFASLLLRSLGCMGAYDSLLQPVLDCFGARIILTGPGALADDAEKRELFAQAVARFLETAHNGKPLQILVFGLPDLPVSPEWDKTVISNNY